MIYLLILLLVIALLFARYPIEQPAKTIIYVLLAATAILAILGMVGMFGR